MTNTILPNRYCCGLVMYLGKVGTLATLTCRRPNACAANPMASPTPPMVISVWLSERMLSPSQAKFCATAPASWAKAGQQRANSKMPESRTRMLQHSPSKRPTDLGFQRDRAASAPPHLPRGKGECEAGHNEHPVAGTQRFALPAAGVRIEPGRPLRLACPLS